MSIDRALAEATLAKLPKHLRQLYQILKDQGIDLTDLAEASIKGVKLHQMGYKDDEGNPGTQDLVSIHLSPSWENGPAWPVIQPGPTGKLNAPARKANRRKKWLTAFIIPDVQFGYFDVGDGDERILEPIHDEAALAVALALAKDAQPDVIVLNGDNGDFAEMSKYRLSPVFEQMMQPTVNRLSKFAVELRTACPDAEIIWLEGNHEARLVFYIMDNAKAAWKLKRGLEPKGWPVLSLPHLCHFEDTGIEYLSGYPANRYWLNDNFKVVHGDRTKSNGSTAHAYLNDARVSVCYGHVHRRELAQRTRDIRAGERTVTAVSFGCLARIDGVVPSTRSGIHAGTGLPVRTTEDWQQGCGFIHFQPDGRAPEAIDTIEIVNGWAMHGGTEYGRYRGRQEAAK